MRSPSRGEKPRRCTRVHAVDAEAGQDALALRRNGPRLRLPSEAVGDQHEAALLGQIGHLADGDERVLQDRRDHREILGIGSARSLSPAMARP